MLALTGEALGNVLSDHDYGLVQAAEVYKRARAGSVPEEVVMDLAGQRHSLWVRSSSTAPEKGGEARVVMAVAVEEES